MSNTESTSRCRLQRINVSLGPFARDERLDFVDHVCGLLAGSRFGSGSSYQPISEYSVSDGPPMVGSEMPDEFLDITEQLRMHANEIRPVSIRDSKHIDVGSGRIRASSYGDAGELHLLDLLVTSPLAVARGSPLMSRRVTRFSFATLRICGKLFEVFRKLRRAGIRKSPAKLRSRKVRKSFSVFAGNLSYPSEC